MEFPSFLARIRIVFASLALSISIASIMPKDFFGWWILYDYSVWASWLLVLLAAYLDLRLFWRSQGYGCASTGLLSLTGASMASIGRVASLLMNLSRDIPGFIGPLLGTTYSLESYILSGSLMVSGSSLAFSASLIHTVVGRPIVFCKAPSFEELFGGFKGSLSRLWKAFWSHPWLYAAASFLFGFLYRLIPELIWWPWLIGWDTVEYAAHLMDFSERLNPFASYHWMGSLRNTPPLLNIFLLPPACLIGAWYSFKLYSPLAYGTMALASALLARRCFGSGSLGAFFASMVTTLYILNLRIA